MSEARRMAGVPRLMARLRRRAHYCLDVEWKALCVFDGARLVRRKSCAGT